MSICRQKSEDVPNSSQDVLDRLIGEEAALTKAPANDRFPASPTGAPRGSQHSSAWSVCLCLVVEPHGFRAARRKRPGSGGRTRAASRRKRLEPDGAQASRRSSPHPVVQRQHRKSRRGSSARWCARPRPPRSRIDLASLDEVDAADSGTPGVARASNTERGPPGLHRDPRPPPGPSTRARGFQRATPASP